MITSCYSDPQQVTTGNSKSTIELWCRMMEILFRQSLGVSESEDPFSVGPGALFIGVGCWYFAENSGDHVWHVRGPTCTVSGSLGPLWHRFELHSNRSRIHPIEVKFGMDILQHVCKLLWKFHGIWIIGLRDMIDSRLRLRVPCLLRLDPMDSFESIWFKSIGSNP